MSPFDEVTLGPISLPNRFVKTATYEGMTPDGVVTDALIAHHADMAGNGVGLTTVAYGAVSESGRTFKRQLLVSPQAGLERLADAVHDRGGRVSLQLAHCGGFSKHSRPQGPSSGLNPYGLTSGSGWIRAMSEDAILRTIDEVRMAAEVAANTGFDAVEVHAGHGYLLSQFLSPVVNHRGDRWGGDLFNRARLSVEVVRAVADAVGDRAAVLVKVNLSDGVQGGNGVMEAVRVVDWLAEAGAHAVIGSGGLVQRSAFHLLRGDVPLSDMASVQDGLLQQWGMRIFGRFLVPAVPYHSCFFWEEAKTLLDGSSVPVGLLGGIDSTEAVNSAIQAGFALVVMGRALLADPDFIARMRRGEVFSSRCDHCNQCVVEMDRGGVRCVL